MLKLFCILNNVIPYVQKVIKVLILIFKNVHTFPLLTHFTIGKKYFLADNCKGCFSSHCFHDLPVQEVGLSNRSDKSSADGSTSTYKRRIKTEEKGKVVTSVWGKDFIQFLAALAFLPERFWIQGWIAPPVTILNNRRNWGIAPGWFERKGWIHPIL